MTEPPANPPAFPHAEIFVDIQREWNAAEESIKIGEQIALDLSIPSISELRYAGRRLIDALDLACQGGAEDKIRAVLEDARFCCHRARHDAIDAALSKIAIDLNDMTKRLGYDAVTRAYPDFSELYVSFAAAREKVAYSRGNRQSRNAIYETVAAVDFPDIARRYIALVVCKPIALAHAAKARRDRIGWWVLLILAVLAAIFAGLAVDWPKVRNNGLPMFGLSSKQSAALELPKPTPAQPPDTPPAPHQSPPAHTP